MERDIDNLHLYEELFGILVKAESDFPHIFVWKKPGK